MRKQSVALLVGYFDWFSGYQETVLARTLAPMVDLEIICSDRVSPIFTQAHLERLGVDRRYRTGTTVEHGARVTRLPTREMRSMVWSPAVLRRLRSSTYDLIVQVMPGQGLSAAAALVPKRERRVALYGDNSGMWSALPQWKQRVKWIGFAVTKGQLYRLVNRRSDVVYGYTPETIERLAPFLHGRTTAVLPLTFDPAVFYVDPGRRNDVRDELGIRPQERVVITAGKFQPYKRLELLIDAFREVAEANTDVRLLLVGHDGGPYASSLEAKVEGCGAVRDRVTFLGFETASRLNGLFNAADVGVWPVLPAVTIQQALGTGLAVCLPRNSWVGHLLRPGTGAYYATEPTSHLLAKALQNSLEAFDFGQEARERRAAINSWLSSEGLARQVLQGLGTVAYDPISGG